jgi:hypothetical protein
MDQFSLTTTPIEQFFNNMLLGTATGFVWSNSGIEMVAETLEKGKTPHT